MRKRTSSSAFLDWVVSFSSCENQKQPTNRSFAIKPPHIRKSQVFTTFELLHDDLMRHLWDKTKANEVRNEIQHLATSYVNFYKLSINDLKIET